MSARDGPSAQTLKLSRIGLIRIDRKSINNESGFSLANVSGLKKVPNIDGGRIARFGHLVSRYGLVVVLAWIGAGKYVKMESRVLIQHSPLMSWLYDFLSFKALANVLGTMEIIAAILIAVRPLWPRISALGSALAIVLFLGTISFLFTTPGVIADFVHGFPVLSAQPGQFLLKDLVLMGVALWTLGDSIEAGRARRTNNASSRV